MVAVSRNETLSEWQTAYPLLLPLRSRQIRGYPLVPAVRGGESNGYPALEPGHGPFGRG
jgi:hypothetical protein